MKAERHPITGRFMAGDCEVDCLDYCAGLCGVTVEKHALTHREFTDGTLTPACICGWYSPGREHADFERHLRRVST